LEFTPQELSGVLFYHTQNEDEEFKAGWEKTRQQTFYLINIQLDKKSKLNYEKFKTDIWPFAWEKPTQEQKPIKGMTSDDWIELFDKPIINETKIINGNL